jgi:hypothetical protein
MAEFKRRTLFLSSGKQVKLFGNSVAIGKSLEIGEGYSPNILSCIQQEVETTKPGSTGKVLPDNPKEKIISRLAATVSNPFSLSETDLMEIADYNIRLWLDLKDNIRKHGINSPQLFNSEALRS